MKRRWKHTGPESPIERILYQAMRDYGLIPVCQYEIGRYRTDFAFLEERLIVEADGAAYHSSLRARRKDAIRDKYLKNRGWRVMHFTGAAIINDAYFCARMIRKGLGKRG